MREMRGEVGKADFFRYFVHLQKIIYYYLKINIKVSHYFGQSQYPWKTSNYEWFADINIFGGLIVMEYVIILYTMFTYVKGKSMENLIL